MILKFRRSRVRFNDCISTSPLLLFVSVRESETRILLKNIHARSGILSLPKSLSTAAKSVFVCRRTWTQTDRSESICMILRRYCETPSVNEFFAAIPLHKIANTPSCSLQLVFLSTNEKASSHSESSLALTLFAGRCDEPLIIWCKLNGNTFELSMDKPWNEGLRHSTIIKTYKI